MLSAWFKDERPQGLSWQSTLKGYYTILWQKYKNRFFRVFFFLVKMVLVLYKGTRTQKLIWKNPLKRYCIILKKKMKKFYFSIFWWKSVVGMIGWAPSRVKLAKCINGILYMYHFMTKNKNRFFGIFFLWKWFLVLFKGTRTQELIWKIPLKGYCMILKKKMKNFIFQFLMKICCRHD